MVTKGTMDQNLEVGLARRAIDIQFLKVDFAENDLFVAAPCMCITVLKDDVPRGATRTLPNNTAIIHAKRLRSIAV